MFSRMHLATFAACLSLVAASVAQQRDSRFLISANRVAEALVGAGVQVSPGQVRFLSPVSSNDRDPSLRVINVNRWAGDSYKAELRCRDHAACLPFYVLLTGSEKTDTRGQVVNSESAIRGRSVGLSPAETALVRDGDNATLVFENSSLRISLPVICLQSGNRGQTIRVESRDHKRFFKAEIVEAGLLRASL